MSLTMEERVTRFETMRREDRLLREVWTSTDADGRERACWLAAISPEVGSARISSACPADVMPSWLALLTPNLDDHVSDGAWPAMAERFGRCAARWHALDADAWARVERAVKLEALILAREAVTTDLWGVLPAIDEVLRLLREGGPRQAWADAARAAYAAGVAAARAPYAAAHAAKVARSAAYAARFAARSDRSAADAASDAASNAADDAWDRIAAALFDAIDREVHDREIINLQTRETP